MGGPGPSSLKALEEPQETRCRRVFGRLNSGLASFPAAGTGGKDACNGGTHSMPGIWSACRLPSHSISLHSSLSSRFAGLLLVPHMLQDLPSLEPLHLLYILPKPSSPDVS